MSTHIMIHISFIACKTVKTWLYWDISYLVLCNDWSTHQACLHFWGSWVRCLMETYIGSIMMKIMRHILREGASCPSHATLSVILHSNSNCTKVFTPTANGIDTCFTNMELSWHTHVERLSKLCGQMIPETVKGMCCPTLFYMLNVYGETRCWTSVINRAIVNTRTKEFLLAMTCKYILEPDMGFNALISVSSVKINSVISYSLLNVWWLQFSTKKVERSTRQGIF